MLYRKDRIRNIYTLSDYLKIPFMDLLNLPICDIEELVKTKERLIEKENAQLE